MDSELTASLNGMHDYPIAVLLAIARQRIDEGQPSLALQAVVTALKAAGGEGAVLQTLARARDVYRSRMRANAAADELAALFAECAIAEASPTPPLPNDEMHELQSYIPSMLPVSSLPSFQHDSRMENDSGDFQTATPILAESGRMQILVDASSDGSSFICLQCGGLVSNLRRDEHVAYWCSYATS